MSDDRVARNLVENIKLSCPRFSVPKDHDAYERLIRLWSSALSVVDYPPNVFEDAFALWLRGASSQDNPPMPGDILAACRRVVAEIESDPVRGPRLREWRERRRDERIRRLSAPESA